METWFAFLMMTLYLYNDELNIQNMWIIRNLKSPPRRIFFGIIFLGIIGSLIAAITNTPIFSYIFLTFIFIASECIFRMYEKDFDSHQSDES